MAVDVKRVPRLPRPIVVGALVVVLVAIVLTGIDRGFFWFDVANEIGVNASARSGGDYSIGSPDDIRQLSILARNGHNIHARVVVEDDYAIAVVFYEDADAALFKRSGRGWTKVEGGVLPDSCALMRLGVPWFTAGKLESAVYASEASPPHHDPCSK